jgi:ABC-type transport system involved in cytochrome c biogenesis permease subunit
VVNTALAQVSNAALVSAIMLYGFAMLAYACDFLYNRRRVPAAAPKAAARAKVAEAALVGAGGPDLADHNFGADPTDAAAQLADLSQPSGSGGGGTVLAPRWPQGSWLRTAFVLTCLGLGMHLAAIVTRGLAEHRFPWGNMYEFISAITCAAVLILTLAAIKFRAYYMGLFVLLPVVVALAIDVAVIYTPAGAVAPALNSYWIAIHVTGMIIAIGMYIFGAVTTVLYLMAARHERKVAAGEESGLAGIIWADHAWGRYWGWDPKETWSFIVWIVYAAFLHARATAGWRGRKAAYIQLFGFTCVLFNLVGVNLWITGLHSYAGLT